MAFAATARGLKRRELKRVNLVLVSVANRSIVGRQLRMVQSWSNDCWETDQSLDRRDCASASWLLEPGMKRGINVILWAWHQSRIFRASRKREGTRPAHLV